MRLATIVDFLSQNLKDMRLSRIKTLAALVFALLKGGVAGLTALGNHLPGKAYTKHKIKRVDRFLGNENLSFRDISPILCSFLPAKGPFLVLVDWTDHQGELYQSLVAQVPIEGRSIPLLARTYRKKGIDQSQAEMDFLICTFALCA
jgi:hypothetical protein